MIVRRFLRVIFGLSILYDVAIRSSLARHGLLGPDSGRDTAMAWMIARVFYVPLEGPFQRSASDPATDGVHVGPLYHYLSAIPLYRFGTALSLLLCTSLLNLISMYLGYQLGELLFRRKVAIAFALLVGADFMATITAPLGGHVGVVIPTCLTYHVADAPRGIVSDVRGSRGVRGA